MRWTVDMRDLQDMKLQMPLLEEEDQKKDSLNQVVRLVTLRKGSHDMEKGRKIKVLDWNLLPTRSQSRKLIKHSTERNKELLVESD